MQIPEKLKLFVAAHENEDVRSLALQARRYADMDMNQAIRQITGRRIAKEKIPTWYENPDIIYPAHLSLEQCSSEATARYKASLCTGNTMADLTGGMGVDISFLAGNFKQATYVEQQTELTEIAGYNFHVLGLENIGTVNADAVQYLAGMQPVDLIYIDPARRDNAGKKTVGIEDCTPNLLEIEDLLLQKAKMVMLKLSPMLDISLALKELKYVSGVHIVAVNNEVKELLFVMQKKEENAPFLPIHCVNIQKNGIETFSFHKEDESSSVVHYVSDMKKYLYEPNAAIMKGGAYKSIAKAYGLQKLHPSSHLYTSDEFHTDFPGRKFTVKNVTGLKNLLRLDKANITVRNFPLSVAEIRQKTGIKEGGNTYIFATTLAGERKVLVIAEKN